MMADPTINEVMIHLTNATKQLDSLAGRLDRMQAIQEQSYVRKDVYENKHEALRAEVGSKFRGLERDIEELQQESKEQAKYRRQTWTAIALALVTALIGILVGLVTGGGVTPT